MYIYLKVCILQVAFGSKAFENLFNRAARSPQGPGTKSTMDESNSESKTTTNGKETRDIDNWKSEVSSRCGLATTRAVATPIEAVDH